MAEPSAPRAKLCHDCGRERWMPGGCWFGFDACVEQDDIDHFRLAYAREKAARERVEAEVQKLKLECVDAVSHAMSAFNASVTKHGAARDQAEARADKLEELLREARRFVPRLGVGDLCARIDAALPPEAGGHSPKEKG